MRAGVTVLMMLILSVPAVADEGVAFEDRIERAVASPTPAGPALLLSDRHAYAITLDDVAYVEVFAESDPTSTFYLTASCVPGIVAAPASRQSIACSDPGTHTIEVDPAAGAAVNIRILFRGYIADPDDGEPYPFGFSRTAADRSCVVPGTCLP